MICDTLQGTLLKAEIIQSTKDNQHFGEVGSLVAIKRVEKALVDKGIIVEATEDEFQKELFSITVDENIQKAARVLEYLTLKNKCPCDKIAKFVEFFEDATYYYLVTEYVEGITLKELCNNL